MQNNYPRIYSLSTIGIKQHYNADYLFHNNRTDFSGESGSGKSMVSDMIQLILIGSANFESSTDGNKPREVKGMVLDLKGKSSGRGYIFLNIEISRNEFIVIGAYIESTSNQAELFIIQNGYDWETLIPLETPFFFNELILNNNIETLNSISEKINNANIKSFSRKKYHQLLFENEIIALDLTQKDILKSFASILSSFSRGKGFKVDSFHLKNFLFGDDDQNSIKKKYDEEVVNINNDLHEHKRYLEEIELINSKQKLLKDVLEKHNTYKEIYTQYLTTKYGYWSKIYADEKSNKKRLKNTYYTRLIELLSNELAIKSCEIEEIKDLKLKKEDYIKKKSSFKNSKQNESEVKKEYTSSLQKMEIIEKVQKWFDANENDIEKVRLWYSRQKDKQEIKTQLLSFIDYLKKEKIIIELEKSVWLSDFNKAKNEYSNKVEELQKKINELEVLSVFSDFTNKASLSNWAFDNLKFPLSPINESILLYFQNLSRNKPIDLTKTNRYLPFPNELFENLDIKDKTDNGFFLNLDGVYEYVVFTEKQHLNISDVKSLKESLRSLKSDINEKLTSLKKELEQKIRIKEILFNYGNIKSQIDLYKDKDNILAFVINNSINIELQEFNEYLDLYKKKESVFNEHKEKDSKYRSSLEKDKLIIELKEHIKNLEETYFSKNSVEIKEINRKISELEGELINEENKLQDKIKEANFSPDKALKSYSEKSNITQLLKNNIHLNNQFQKIENEKEDNLNKIKLSFSKIEEATNDYFLLFNKEFKEPSLKEVMNPENGKNSLSEKAKTTKVAFEQKFKLVQENLNIKNLDESYSIGMLAHQLLPTVFQTSKIDESLIESNITERLNKLTQDIQEIGSRKVEILKRIFNEVYKVYNGYLTKITLIDSYLRNNKRIITGGNRASLIYKKSLDYPDGWLAQFRKQLDSQFSSIGLFASLKEELNINKMMLEAFKKTGGNQKVTPDDLMNPKSYFDLEFDLKLENGDINSGSNGQTYTANALLALARLSLIKDERRKGIKIMPIDEAEGLGSNYDMLHQLAKNEGYQIVTMGIETTGEILEGEQYIYIMSENNISNNETYVPPFAIFSDLNEVIEDIDHYIKSEHNNG